MLSTDYYYLERALWRVRNGRCRTDISFDSGMTLGYLAALLAHGGISLPERERLDCLLDNAQQHAMTTVFDLEAQGWS